jgi:hypothetical protein
MKNTTPPALFISPLLVAILMISMSVGVAVCAPQVLPHRAESSTQTISGDSRQMYDIMKIHVTAKANPSNNRMTETIF